MESSSVEWRAKVVSEMFERIRLLCSDLELGRYEELVLCTVNKK